MAIDLTSTKTMLAAMEAVKPKATFLRDRYFPSADKDIFPTEDVIVEYKDESSNKLAPVVIPYKGGIPVKRDGYTIHTMTPPTIAPERPLTLDTLKKKQFGEALFSGQTAQQREASIIAQDITDLNTMIDLREEYMAAQALINNGYTMKQYADKYGGTEYEEYELKFYDGNSNPAVYTPQANWSTSSTAILSDIAAMAKMLKSRGLRASELIVSGAVADIILNNTALQKIADNRRMELAYAIKPEELPNGATRVATFNCKGTIVDIISYEFEYVDESGSTSKFIPDGKVILTAPGMGRTAYGAITQLEEATRDFVTYSARRVPHVITNSHDNTRTLIQQAKPLVMPNVRNSAISATVLS